MRPAFQNPSSDRAGALFRRRTTAFVLVLAAHGLLVVMLLNLTPPPHPPETEATLVTFELLPASRTTAARTVAKAKRATSSTLPRSPEKPSAPIEAAPSPDQTIWLTSEAFAAADIAKMPSRNRTAADTGAGQDSSVADASGGGPNGERLYEAEWYREPTQAELAYYLPAGAPRTGWAMIACQTVEDRRVDNCRELDQSPAGSGLAGAVRQAAWQFRVLPPRIGGRPVIGAWVRIRIDYTEAAAN